MKFKNCGLAGRIPRDGHDVANGIITISNGVASIGHDSNESSKLIVAITDRTRDRLAWRCNSGHQYA
jgi:hypothetical protein